MNRLFFGFMIMMAMLVLVFGMSPMIKTMVDDARDSTNLDCDNAAISDVNKVTCIVTDMSMFYFIAGLIALAIGVFVGGKFS